MNNLLDRAFYLAKNGDVSTAKDGAVVYSISFMPNEENKNQAFDFVKLNQNAKMLDDTPCGKALIELGFREEDIEKGWIRSVLYSLHNVLSLCKSRQAMSLRD